MDGKLKIISIDRTNNQYSMRETHFVDTPTGVSAQELFTFIVNG
jgi:hypothetical protein